MPKRRQRRPAFRGPAPSRDERTAAQAAIEAGARRLLNYHDAKSLESLVHDLRSLRDEADRNAQDIPSPEALSQFRRAERELAEAEKALILSKDAA